jgi:entericidin B
MIRKYLLALLAAVVLAGVVTGCNTTRGVGQDLESVGEDIQDTAK